MYLKSRNRIMKVAKWKVLRDIGSEVKVSYVSGHIRAQYLRGAYFANGSAWFRIGGVLGGGAWASLDDIEHMEHWLDIVLCDIRQCQILTLFYRAWLRLRHGKPSTTTALLPRNDRR